MNNNTPSSKFALRKPTSKQKGFSLIELLIVVVIIGIIAAIAVPNLIASRRAANEAAAIANCRSLHSAQTTHFSVYGAYAATLGRLVLTGYLDDRFGKTLGNNAAKVNGFNYHMIAPTSDFTKNTTTQTTNRYIFHAHPIVSSTTNPLGSGGRTFYISSDEGLLYSALGNPGISTGATAIPTAGSTVIKPLTP
jgi:prepilin-type N-terminal cleavage/methylation domain-containing protein